MPSCAANSRVKYAPAHMLTKSVYRFGDIPYSESSKDWCGSLTGVAWEPISSRSGLDTVSGAHQVFEGLQSGQGDQFDYTLVRCGQRGMPQVFNNKPPLLGAEQLKERRARRVEVVPSVDLIIVDTTSRFMFLQRLPLCVEFLEAIGRQLDDGVAVYEFTMFNVVGGGTRQNLDIVLVGSHESNSDNHSSTHINAVFSRAGYVTTAQVGMRNDTRTYMRTYKCPDIATKMCTDMCVDLCTDLHTDLFADVCTDMRWAG